MNEPKMSLTLFNQSAHNYEQKKQQNMTVTLKSMGYQNEFQAPGNVRYNINSAFIEINAVPEDYGCQGFGEGFAMWLQKELGKTFFFPQDGLQDEAKEQLIQALRILYRKVSDEEIKPKDEILDTFIGAFANSDMKMVNCSPGFLSDIARLGKFLKENEIIYTW
ncbi:MAG: hypothetical protein AAFW70_23795 [Cyanobacteria bacterium J06635_10]